MKKKDVEEVEKFLNEVVELVDEVNYCRDSLSDILKSVKELFNFFHEFKDIVYKEISILKKRLDIIVEINNLKDAAKDDN